MGRKLVRGKGLQLQPKTKQEPLWHLEAVTVRGYSVRRCSLTPDGEITGSGRAARITPNPKYVTCEKCLALMEQDNSREDGENK